MRRNLPFLTLSALILLVLLSLGNWQVRRWGEKQAYLSAIEDKLQAAPEALPAQPNPEHDQFRAVKASGTLQKPEIHVLVSTRDHGAGYRIIQAFETEGRRVLVDRGYIRLTSKDKIRARARLEITGNLHWPEERDNYTPQNDLAANIWYAREVPKLAAALGTEPLLIIAAKTTPNDTTILPLPVTTEGIPNRHLEYIITWYGLAAVWVIMTLYFLKRRSRKDT